MVELSFRFFPYYLSFVLIMETNHRSLGDLESIFILEANRKPDSSR